MEHVIKYQEILDKQILEKAHNMGFKTVEQYYESLGLIGYPSVDEPWVTDQTKKYTIDDVKDINEYKLYQELNPNLDEKFYYYYGKWVTRGENKEKVEMMKRSLQKLGITPGTKVGISLVSTPEIFYLVQALQYFETEKIILNPTNEPEILRGQIDETKPDILFTHDGFIGDYSKVAKKNDFQHVFNVSVADSMTMLPKCIYSMASLAEIRQTKRQIQQFGSSINGDVWNMNQLSKYGEDVKHVDEIKHDPNRIILNGGSSGTTTGCPSRHSFVSKEMNAIIMQHLWQDLYKQQQLKRRDFYYHTLPLVVPLSYTSGSNLFGGMGLKFYLNPQHHQDLYAKQLVQAAKFARKEDRKFFGMTDAATMNESIKSGKLDNADLTNLAFLTLGGEACARRVEEDINECGSEHGVSLKASKGYGITSKCGVVTFGGTGIIGSQGKPCMLYKTRIMSLSNPEIELSYNQIGYIFVDNPFQKNPESPNTRDIGWMDETGELFPIGREIDSIMSPDGKSKAYAADMTKLIELNEEVRLAKVVAVKVENENNEKVEKLAIFMEVIDEYQNRTEEVREKIYNQMVTIYPEFAQPDGIIIQNLPITLVGKYDMRGMTRQYEETVAQKKLIKC